jgi:microcystin-dependent protein
MADAYLGEIRIFAGSFAPKGWALCNGQLLPIVQNTALFSILGTMYGGDGKTTFALPNLMGRAPIGVGAGPGLTPRTQGKMEGSNTVTLNTTQIPAHTHIAQYGDSVSGDPVLPGSLWAATPGRGGKATYSEPNSLVNMSLEAIQPAGGGAPHNNMQPYLAMNYIICLQGEFPARD